MVEIHEPVRILFVIETTPAAMQRLIESEDAFRLLVEHRWVQVAVFDPESAEIRMYRNGRFEPYAPELGELPSADSSWDWYRGQRDHLGFAAVAADRRTSRPHSRSA
jgi:hypothetical protein